VPAPALDENPERPAARIAGRFLFRAQCLTWRIVATNTHAETAHLST
jgi:hypothetical protein